VYAEWGDWKHHSGPNARRQVTVWGGTVAQGGLDAMDEPRQPHIGPDNGFATSGAPVRRIGVGEVQLAEIERPPDRLDTISR